MKRIIDIVLSGMGLMVLAPIGILVAIGSKLTSPGPVFFRQVRLGLYGNTFSIYKFRTMTVQKSGAGCQVTAGDDIRITPFGGFLRHHKLDELPQLLNVFLGHMSLVGPRPEVPEFAELFPQEYARILKVRPGITHPATLTFRSEETILAGLADPRKFYIDHIMPEKLAGYEACLEQSLVQDMQTIIATLVPHLGTAPYGPEFFTFAPNVVSRPQPARTFAAATVDRAVTEIRTVPTLVENIPAFAAAIPREPHVEIEEAVAAVV